MAEERKVEFAGSGTIKKCPNCGAQLEAFQARCPACGFAIGGAERGGSVSLKKFLDAYTNEKDNARKLEMIDTFPIPNTIEDTVEFALLAAQQARSYLMRAVETNSNGGDFIGFKAAFAEVLNGTPASKRITNVDFRIAWQNKLEQICYRAKFSYPQEKEKLAQLEMIIDDVKNVDKGTKKEAKKQSSSTVISLVLLFIVLLGIIFVLSYGLSTLEKKNEAETQRLETLMTEIQADIEEGNYDDAELKVLNLTWNLDDKEKKKDWKEKQQALKKRLEKAKEKAGE
ncbi:MAG: zinc ribbon domain-containing protein [Treponema sp.]|nr:zinc ribbon domain-containing protein [Treponema sp.]